MADLKKLSEYRRFKEYGQFVEALESLGCFNKLAADVEVIKQLSIAAYST